MLARVWDVTELGARGNREANDSAAIQKAIDGASQAGGGTVYVPAGSYRCGQLQLRSHVTLHVEAGATLWVSADKADYKRGNAFLLAQDQNEVAIEGRGTICGTGQEDLQRKRGATAPAGLARRDPEIHGLRERHHPGRHYPAQRQLDARSGALRGRGD